MLANHRQVFNPSRCSMRFASSDGYSVLNSSGLQHWFKNWQGLRKNKLTASTFAAAVGFFHRRRLQLWLEKIGALEPFLGNLATCWSNIKEEEALERYKLITGNSVLFPEFQVYGNRNVGEDWLGASPDGVVDRLVYGLPSRGVLEIKCPFFDGNMKKATPWSRIPLYCVPQAQGLMEILDRDWMDFYVWTPKGSSLFRVYRDAEYWDVLKIVLSDFWWNHVQPAREILSKSQIRDPLVELKSLKPAPRHELCGYMVYESKRVVNNSKLLMREINGKLCRHFNLLICEINGMSSSCNVTLKILHDLKGNQKAIKTVSIISDTTRSRCSNNKAGNEQSFIRMTCLDEIIEPFVSTDFRGKLSV